MSLTYVAVVLVVGIVAALVAYRRGLIGSGAGEWFREQIVGAGRGRGDDLVERLARCLADETVALGASYAVPGFIGVVLPRGVYRAASATKPQLVAEIVARYTELMADQARREGRRQEFLMPAGYTLRLVLACGPSERSVASFEPIGDVHAALGLPTPEMPALRPGISTGMGAGISTGMGDGRQLVSSGSFNATALNGTAVNGTAVNGTAVNSTALNGSLQLGRDAETRNVRTSAEPAQQDVTVQRVPLRETGVAFALSIDGAEVAQCRLSAGSPGVVVIGRGSHVGLRCPAALAEVSREHAELTFADGRVWVEDKHSANGTWLRKADGSAQRLVPGELSPLEADEAIWLDEARRAMVTQLRATA
ncbi:MAG TPA: FHA domain-containing protein [Pseudonocardia sp.]|nr:FHA domain-containing protein [Pseudonocardia sp.]